ncbi:hypothetical protein AB6A40_009282 [Gnathostoma spinigerum]|uniref:Uncharacterized protein n=1 Tax=Gnathostoma spinigerum TaxID=75299 RepID=A0ABD6EZK9_9BILA
MIFKDPNLRVIQKNAFKRYFLVEELVFENCAALENIEKNAFKGLTNLRILRLSNNQRLIDLPKNSFALFSSQPGLRIQLKNNALRTISAGVFRKSEHLRELTIEGINLTIETGAFSTLTTIDFLILKGITTIEKSAFKNISRVYRLDITNSRFNLTEGIFDSLSYMKEVNTMIMTAVL